MSAAIEFIYLERTYTPRRVYLAVPYANKSDGVREFRFRHVTDAAFRLIERGYHVFSPITMGRPMTTRPDGTQMVETAEFAFWREQDLSFLRHWAEMLAVLPLRGWVESVGVAAEIAEARRLGLPVIRLPIDKHGYMT
jgi:hypothetical protein